MISGPIPSPWATVMGTRFDAIGYWASQLRVLELLNQSRQDILANVLRPISIALLTLCAGCASAEVKLPQMLSSHMVLQRNAPIHVWGWAEPGERVSAEMHGANGSAIANKLGEWSLYLPPARAGGPFTLTLKGTNTVVLDDVLVGDVWFASGQSNMEMPLKGFGPDTLVKNGAEEIRNANHPQIRLLFIRHKASDYPLVDYDSTAWTVCSPETAENFSAVAYFFGRDINSREHVPIGLIDATWGGTPGEAWVSMNGLAADPSLMPVFREWARMVNHEAEIPALIKAEKREDAAAREANQPAPKHPWHPETASWGPSELYNGMIAPAVPYGIKGVIWYQGETNSARRRAALYERIFPELIADWRTHWREGNFPFLFVQISSFKSDETENWPIVREAQRRTLAVANTAMAVTIDIGNPDNVHPADKQSVGARLALAARALAYGEQVNYSGPLFRQTSSEPGGLRIWFDDVAGGLVANSGELQGFEVAGEDGRFLPAMARIDGATVLATSPEVQRPKYVRYGWQNVPAVNLFNSEGLPASPFTSEETIPAP